MVAISQLPNGDAQFFRKLQKEPSLLDAKFTQRPNKGESADLHRSDVNVLHIACQEGLHQTILYLLTVKPALASQVSASQWTPMMNACEAGDLTAVKLLTQHDKALIDYVCTSGGPLHAAITSQRQAVDVVGYLLGQN